MSVTKRSIIQKGAKKIGIISCCMDDWGGSEELWARSIPILKEKGAEITLYKKRINFDHAEIRSLAVAGIQLKETDPLLPTYRRQIRRVTKAIRRRLRPADKNYATHTSLESFHRLLKATGPHLMIIAQGINFDGLPYARVCLQLNIPYVLIIQKAVDFYWPQPHEREYMTTCFRKAVKCFFVSNHNKRLTEEQFGIRLSNSVVISNPVKIPVKPIPFPCTDPGFRLACVGRLFILDKGQDMLLRILSEPAWRSRPVRVSLVGTGVDEAGLKGLTELLGLDNIDFLGHIADIEKLWTAHHALVLPSRSEGLPLSVLEAMAAGRPVIVSNAGGNAEIVQDEVTGFIGEACERSFADAMERAWKRKEAWEDMGKKASSHVLSHVQANPPNLFADSINEILYEK